MFITNHFSYMEHRHIRRNGSALLNKIIIKLLDPSPLKRDLSALLDTHFMQKYTLPSAFDRVSSGCRLSLV